MSTQSKLESLAQTAASNARTVWAALVDLALLLPEERIDAAAASLASQMGQSKDNLKRKINAVIYLRSLAHTADDIKSMGQGQCLSRFNKKTNSDRYEQMVAIRWILPGSLRELIRQDMARISEVLGFTTSEQLFEFLHSMLECLSEDELRHLAGELRKKK